MVTEKSLNAIVLECTFGLSTDRRFENLDSSDIKYVRPFSLWTVIHELLPTSSLYRRHMLRTWRRQYTMLFPRTAPRSVQPFLAGSSVWPTRTHARYVHTCVAITRIYHCLLAVLAMPT